MSADEVYADFKSLGDVLKVTDRLMSGGNMSLEVRLTMRNGDGSLIRRVRS